MLISLVKSTGNRKIAMRLFVDTNELPLSESGRYVVSRTLETGLQVHPCENGEGTKPSTRGGVSCLYAPDAAIGSLGGWDVPTERFTALHNAHENVITIADVVPSQLSKRIPKRRKNNRPTLPQLQQSNGAELRDYYSKVRTAVRGLNTLVDQGNVILALGENGKVLATYTRVFTLK